MKKIAAILLICLLLFNWYGYRFFTNYLQQKADRQLESQIDLNQYDESQLVEIKVALDMPYQNDQANFERHYGEIEINGNVYTYVKRKIENGYLVLKCLPNDAKQQIKNVDNNLFKANNGIDQEHSNGKSTPVNSNSKNVFSDYDDYSFNFSLSSQISSQRQFPISGNTAFQSISLPVSEQPPESVEII